MEFDKSRVYTPCNADELELDSKVVVADTLGELKNKVLSTAAIDAVLLQEIRSEFFTNRFAVSQGYYLLAYLVERPTKLKWTDLKVGDIITNDNNMTVMVTAIDSNREPHICTNVWLTNAELEEWRKVNENND